MTGCGCGAFHPTCPGFDSSWATESVEQSFVNDFYPLLANSFYISSILNNVSEVIQTCSILHCCCVWKIIILFSKLIMRVVELWSIVPLHDWIRLYYIALSCTEFIVNLSYYNCNQLLKKTSSKCNKLCIDNNDNFQKLLSIFWPFAWFSTFLLSTVGLVCLLCLCVYVKSWPPPM